LLATSVSGREQARSYDDRACTPSQRRLFIVICLDCHNNETFTA